VEDLTDPNNPVLPVGFFYLLKVYLSTGWIGFSTDLSFLLFDSVYKKPLIKK
jgi:hypothetical protein